LVEIRDTHTNIVRIEKNHKVLFKKGEKADVRPDGSERLEATVAELYDFANTVDLDDVTQLFNRQIDYNLKIAREGLEHSYSANVGLTLLECYGDGISIVAAAYPAAGCDARMSRCTLPVVINSGSGNQGLTVSLPVIKYVEYLNVSLEKLYRALVMSNLIAILQKEEIGRMSAYCGVVSAACGSGTGIAYLEGASLEIIEQTIINTLANVSGVVCDGAKPLCAAKIASAVNATLLGYQMARRGRTFHSGEGIVKKTTEATICAVGRLAREGMRETDIELLKIMID